MARIPLRSYNREIEELIDRGQIEEAIAHAKNILKQYPKYIETYRLLGKAYIESQRYTEALDILQRVLSVIPDDFVSQLGMSIIREDEGNLDAAIWHMERAYEVHPFNNAVQDELRRLYGRRDGVEPPRIRLTRGALVRMYTRGDLYPQAIAETRAALGEDPQRLDMMALLMRLYFLAGQKVEAAEIASTLITKLPYCLEANRTLMEILPGTSRAEETSAFQRRVFDLDPYTRHLTPNTPTSEQVPEGAVTVERVEWQPSSEEAQQPDWTRTIGAQWEEPAEEALPDWLNGLEQPASNQAADAVTPTDQPPSPQADLVPDFMRDAGWEPATHPETAPPALSEEPEHSPQEPTSAEMPEWIQPPAHEVENQPAESTEDLTWLNGLFAAEETSAAPETPAVENAAVEPAPTEAAPTAENEIPDWLRDLSTAESGPNAAESAPTAEELPDWLKEALPAEPAAAEPLSWIQENEEPQAKMAEASAPEPVQTEEEASTPQSVEPIQAEVEAALLASPVQGEPVAPEAVSNMPTTAAPQEAAPEPQTPEAGTDMDAALAWMEALAARQGADADTLKISAPEQRSETPPDWLASLSTAATPVAEPEAPGPAEPAAAVEPETPVAIEPLAASEPETPVAVEPVAADVLETPAEPAPTAFVQPEAALPDINDMDAALAWMEALAAKQGAEEGTLKISEPSQRSETPPEWIAGLAADGQPAEEKGAGEPTAAEMPSPLQDETLPDWLRGMAAEEPTSAVEEAPAEVHPEPGPSDLPAWLMEDAQPVVAETQATVPQPEPDIPTQPVKVSLVESAQPDLNDQDAALAWMEDLAHQQNAEQAETLAAVPEAGQTAVAPEWVTEFAQTDEAAHVTKPALEALEPPASPPMNVEPTVTVPPAEEKPAAVTDAPASEPELAVAEQPADLEIPEWLLNYDAEKTPAKAEETPAKVSQEDSVSAWLQEFHPEPGAEPPSEQIQETPVSAIEQPAPQADLPALDMAQIEAALQQGGDLDTVIQQVRSALDRQPGDAALWQTLGDAYIRADKVQEALDAYSKAEELLS